MAKKATAKGKNKRCGEQLYVGGVASEPGESSWVLRDGEVVLVRSRKQLSEWPERIVVTSGGRRPEPESFDPTGVLGEGEWAGYSSAGLAKGGKAKRAGEAIAMATGSENPSLSGRVKRNVSVRPVLDLGADAPTTEALSGLADAIRSQGGRAIVVGGAARDMLVGQMRGKPISAKDVDIEVFGMEPGAIRALLESRHSVDATGASFEVLKAHVKGTKHPLDVSVPRREKAIGEGHRDFEVSADPTMSFAEAARRRDFTIGAMGFDPLTGELLDPYGGAADLAAGVLRHVSDAFDEDPLRALRAARFAARFGLEVHPETVEKCRGLRAQGELLPVERRWGEIEATMSQAPTPGRALHVLDEIEWIDMFGPLADLRGVEQDPHWHPEGDVFTHTAHVLDYWAEHLKTGDEEIDMIVSTAAMCHDLGKPGTSVVKDGRITSYNHEAAGVVPTKELLEGLGQVALAKKVVPLVENHLAPIQLFEAGASDKAVRRLSTKVDDLSLLAAVCEADQGGRPPLDPARAREATAWLMERASALGVDQGPPKALARGDHLIEMGLKPGPEFKELLGQAWEAQIDGDISSEEEARSFLSRLVAQRD